MTTAKIQEMLEVMKEGGLIRAWRFMPNVNNQDHHQFMLNGSGRWLHADERNQEHHILTGILAEVVEALGWWLVIDRKHKNVLLQNMDDMNKTMSCCKHNDILSNLFEAWRKIREV